MNNKYWSIEIILYFKGIYVSRIIHDTISSEYIGHKSLSVCVWDRSASGIIFTELSSVSARSISYWFSSFSWGFISSKDIKHIRGLKCRRKKVFRDRKCVRGMHCLRVSHGLHCLKVSHVLPPLSHVMSYYFIPHSVFYIPC